MAPSTANHTGKKKKQLEKYIEKKLKKEERVGILEKLVRTQAEIPSSLHLQSSAVLGSGRAARYALKRSADESADTQESRPQKTRKVKNGNWTHQKSRHEPEPDSDSDTSFDSSDSAYDSSENEGDTVEDVNANRVEVKQSDAPRKGCHDVDDPSPGPPKRKTMGFKEWARQQIDAAKGFKTKENGSDDQQAVVPELPSPRPLAKEKKTVDAKGEWRGPLGEDLSIPATTFAEKLLNKPGSKGGIDTASTTGTTSSSPPQKNKAMAVKRPPEVDEARLLLPIVAEEQPIMEAILLNPIVIICGETGSGKTTQVPQFLYEAGFGSPGSDNPGMIGITQPRRVAAISMAARVSHELSLTSSHVSYQIRYDATVSPQTSIKFMTDGVLLRELATDFLLTRYSVIIIDEAHERSMNTDILIGVLSRVIKLREEMWKEGKEGAKPLRLVIMSATLRVSDFAENKTLFAVPPPVINVSSRQYSVTMHFNRRTSPDYVTEAIKKTTKIHTRLPPGGILVFLTGQNEIMSVCRRLEARFSRKAIEVRKKGRATAFIRWNNNANATGDDSVRVAPTQVDLEAEDIDLGESIPEELTSDADDGQKSEDPEALDSDEEQQLDQELGLIVDEETDVPMHIVPLYSLLPSEKQMKVFQPPPPDSRLVVVATNVAETSLTIPGIRYVVDCGRAKERQYDVSTGIQAFRVNWISKASAAQRAGRAGRVGPGHCYRLYSSALYENHFDSFSQPEILRMPIEGVVLQMKAMHIDAVIKFPFPTPPDRATLQKAEKILCYLGALKQSLTAGAEITQLGRTMALFPLSPRFSRMLVSGQQHECLPYVIAIVSALSAGDPFVHEEALLDEDGNGTDEDLSELEHITSDAIRIKETRRLRRKAFFQTQNLHASLGKNTSDIFKLLSVVGAYEYAGGGHRFCEEHFVRPKAMEEIHKLRAQISNIVQANFPGLDAGFMVKLVPPTDLQIKVLRQLLAAAFIDQVAVRKDKIDNTNLSGTQYSNSKGVPYRAMGITEDVFIHPSSLLIGIPPPEYIIYHEIVRTTRIWLKGLTVINPTWLSALGRPSLCTFSKPIKNEQGFMMCIPRFGLDAWELPPIKTDAV
ncbi:hypothetical protein M378DRAFT_985682 [Amanita muscaria Koide BX008]|uniref:RNA helicase n=1 Tax=Amanita muscaria (strain Koide BX008) TaxID=946122 RepID=A0A0C2XG70_AMAMK|nr:hypothetical protein M378DRAFT_985682 [Amanita muscaria Koide BX008]